MKILAICMNIPELRNRPTKEICSKYPGSGFLPHLIKKSEENGWIVKSGEDAKLAITYGEINPSDCYILQEEFNKQGLELIELGAKGQVLVCFESKMYTPYFYDNIPEFRKLFKYQILYQGGTNPLYFPTFDLDEIGKYDKIPWDNRKRICMISSNKQFWSMSTHPDSPSWISAIKNELHTARLKAIEDYPYMDLYGFGWDNLNNIPPQFCYLKKQIAKQWKGAVEDKREILGQYKFAVCYENINQNGYVTEKVVDAHLCGTTPIGFPLSPIPEKKELNMYSNESFSENVWNLLNG